MYTPDNKINQAELALYNARLHLSNNEVDKAYSILVEVVRLHNDFGKAWYELGMIILNVFENSESATECFKNAIETNPQYTPAYLAYADVLFQTSSFAEMNAILNQVIDVKGVRKDLALRRTALLLESQQRFDEAVSKYKEALMNCFENSELKLIENGINRCLTKKKYL